MSLPVHDVRARQSFMMLAGAVVVASALSQALAHPIIVGGEPRFLADQPALTAPTPVLRPLTEIAAPIFAFQAPTPGYEINSPFGLRRLPWEPRGRMHEGVDIAAPEGLPVGSTLAGTVLRAGSSSTYGRFVEVRHAEGLTSLYGHLGSIKKGVVPGATLAAGQAVGLVGNTGRSTGEHLHFEIRSEGKPLNPALFMGKTFATADELPLSAAARFSRRVRLAVVSPATLAKMMPGKAAKAGKGKDAEPVVTARRDGRVRAVLPPIGDPSPAAVAAAAAARGIVLEASPAPIVEAVSAPVQTAAAADD
ncbi:MAG: hypothetical protein BGN86_02740 [Caulobacterales bacterium 68-7]|nr:MAG: hypothetical protein BGN86_02740 [Caulobacterales bacterium 68-7]